MSCRVRTTPSKTLLKNVGLLVEMFVGLLVAMFVALRVTWTGARNRGPSPNSPIQITDACQRQPSMIDPPATRALNERAGTLG
jgi:hypothetical protein